MFNKPSEKIDINSPDPKSDIYISEGERFNKDFAVYDYNRRNMEHERKKEIYQNKKNILYERERKRWEKMDYEYLKAENKIMMNKERNLVGRKNNPGMAFNPLTLQYDNSVQGELLKRRDDESKFRALMRATNIDKHANAGYNIINGEERTIMENRMRKEIEPSVYKKNIDKINEINQRNNNNDNFYTKGPNFQKKQQFQQIPEKNEFISNKEQINNNEYQQMPIQERGSEFKNIPPNHNHQRENPNDNENRKITSNENNFNNIPPMDNYQRMNPNENNFNFAPSDNYQRIAPNNNYDNDLHFNDRNYFPPNENNYERIPTNNNYNNIQENRDYIRTPRSENNYRESNQIQKNEMIPEHYSEPDRGFKNNVNDFDRQYNYMGYQGQNTYEDYKNQDYNNGKQSPNDYLNRNRDPYARPDYYANNKPKVLA